MLRRPLAALVALLALAPVAAGCGSDDLTSVSADQAAASTREAETAKTNLTLKMSGMGLPLPVTVKGSGVTSTSDAKADLTLDFGQIAAALGIADSKTRILLDGGSVFVDPPEVQGMTLPGGAKWVTADFGQALQGMGIDASGLGEIMRISPEQQLAALKAAGSVKNVGKEKIDGVETAHLRGTVKLADYLKALPADRRAKAQKAIDELNKLPGGTGDDFDRPTPVDMWVDEDKLVRRITSKTTIPAQNGVAAGNYEMTMNFSDFGAKLDVKQPAAGQVYDATDDITRALKQAKRQQSGTTTG